MVDQVTGNTETVATKMDLIATAVQRELAFQAKLIPSITDVSEFAEEGLKTIEFPSLSSFTVQKRVEGQPGDAQALLASTDVMNLDQNAYVAWIIDATSRIQSRINTKVANARRAASAHGRQVDLDIIAKIEEVAALSVLGGTPAAVSRDNVLAMREFVLLNDAIEENLQFNVATDQETNLLKIDEFTRNDVYGSPVIRTGIIGSLYGIPVMRHNGLKSGQMTLHEKTAVAIGFQKAPTFDEQKANEYGAGAMREVLDQLYGLMGQFLGKKGAAASESPLVAKLID